MRSRRSRPLDVIQPGPLMSDPLSGFSAGCEPPAVPAIAAIDPASAQTAAGKQSEIPAKHPGRSIAARATAPASQTPGCRLPGSPRPATAAVAGPAQTAIATSVPAGSSQSGLGANPRNTAETSRVDCAVKLPRWNNNRDQRLAQCDAHRAAGHRDQRHQSDGLIDQAGTPGATGTGCAGARSPAAGNSKPE